MPQFGRSAFGRDCVRWRHFCLCALPEGNLSAYISYPKVTFTETHKIAVAVLFLVASRCGGTPFLKRGLSHCYRFELSCPLFLFLASDSPLFCPSSYSRCRFKW
jgi:hypothetical protein